MKRFISFSIILLSFAIPADFAIAAESMRIFKLKMQSPQAAAMVLRRTFGGKARVAEAPMVNSVIVSTEEPGLLDQAEALLKDIDKIPATLLYQIRSQSEEEADITTVEANIKTNSKGRRNTFRIDPLLERRQLHSQGGETRSIIGMEGEPVSLTTEMTCVERLDSLYGPQDVIRTAQRGLQISGRMIGENEVMVEVWYAEGGFDSARKLITQVKAPLGQWFQLGEVGDEGGNTVTDSGVQSPNANARKSWGKAETRKNYMIRIEKKR